MIADTLARLPSAAGAVAAEPRTGATTQRLLAPGSTWPLGLALAALSGAMYASAFPPLSCSLLAWVALVPLLVACAVLSPGRAVVAGLCWTAALGAGVAGFLPAMLSSYFGLGAAPSLLATLLTAVVHGLYVGAYGAWVAWLTARRAAGPLLLASGWLVCEFALAQGGLDGPWVLAAYSQVQVLPLIQIADLAGPYGIGLLIAAVNAGLAAVLVPALRGRRPLLSALVIVGAGLGAIIYGHCRIAQEFADGPSVPVAVVQGGALTTEPAARTERLRRYLSLTAQQATPASLIVWPEHAIGAYLEESSPSRDAVLRGAAEANADLVLGAPSFVPASSGPRYHNSVYLIRDGRLAARYDKHRLVPFAEDDRLEWLLGRKATSYSPGTGSFVLPATDLRVGALLCVEAMFPDLVRQAVQQGAEVLVNLSNDAWFGDAVPARHQLDIATLRAVENRRYLVRAAATGFSAVIDPHGRTLLRSNFDAAQVLNGSVRAVHVRTLYQRCGDAFVRVVIAAVAVATLRLCLIRPTRPH